VVTKLVEMEILLLLVHPKEATVEMLLQIANQDQGLKVVQRVEVEQVQLEEALVLGVQALHKPQTVEMDQQAKLQVPL
jgi:type IV secretory pathway component VirB8